MTSGTKQVLMRKMVRGSAVVVAFASLFAQGCDQPDTPPRPEVSAEVRVESSQALDASARDVEQKKDELVARAERELVQMRADFDRLKERAKSATGAARARLERRIADLEPRWRETEAKLAGFRARTRAAWREAREGLDRALSALRESYREVRSELERG
jgi:uncharacterized protein involved in exopolysaccharide biosynthesis